MNGDRYPELIFIGDFGTSKYYINDGDGTFTDFTAGSGTAGVLVGGQEGFLASLSERAAGVIKARS